MSVIEHVLMKCFEKLSKQEEKVKKKKSPFLKSIHVMILSLPSGAAQGGSAMTPSRNILAIFTKIKF